MKNYGKTVSKKVTPQSQPIPGKTMVPNSAGGFTFKCDKWDVLDRFLILGTESNTYYAAAKDLTLKATDNLTACLAEDGLRVIARAVELSTTGRAPKNDPAIFALVVASSHDDVAVRREAYKAVTKVCRIGTHILQYASMANEVRGWGRGLRNACASWYTQRDAKWLGYQVSKYRNRAGWTHKDLLRMAHPKTDLNDEERHAVFDYVMERDTASIPQYLRTSTELLKQDCPLTAKEVAESISDNKFTWEMVHSKYLKEPVVWDALLPHMPLGAMVRQLGNMTACDYLKPNSTAAKIVADKLHDVEEIKRARLHPVSLLMANRTYGGGARRRGTAISPVSTVVDALEDAFYLSFQTIVPTDKRWVLGIDISGSMGGGWGWDCPGNCTPAELAAAFAMVTARTEQQYYMFGFATDFVDLKITAKMDLKSVLKRTSEHTMGGTDCSMPMLHAMQKKIQADMFVVYTDNETWAGQMHPTQALTQYRSAMGIPAKLAVCAFTATEFSIADPTDSGMMDFAGVDSAMPSLLADFARR